MANKHFSAVVSAITELGYVFQRKNSKGYSVFRHPDPQFRHVSLNEKISDAAAGHLIENTRKAHRAFEYQPKRDPQAVKDRQARERAELKRREGSLAQERAEILRRRDAELNGIGARITASEMNELVRRLEQIEREQREIRKLMGAPVGGSHVGTKRARHESGSR